jgi:hypothetical protein
MKYLGDAYQMTLWNAQVLEWTALGRCKNGYRGQLARINIPDTDAGWSSHGRKQRVVW